MEAAAAYDPDNEHSVIYMWGTTGIGYNVAKVKERLGEDAPVDSWALVFDPEYAAKLADCGITLLDSPTDVLPSALAYLGLDPTSTDADDLEKAAELLDGVRPYIRYFHSSQYITDLANGEVCVVGRLLGRRLHRRGAGRGGRQRHRDRLRACRRRARMQWFDMMAIPADAPNPEAALAWINFIMEPQITADITNYVWYANANKESMPLVDPEIRTTRRSSRRPR